MTRILLVEDDKSITDSLSAFLAAEGFETKAVRGQKDALDSLGKENYDLVLLDISLADGNGFAVCSTVKKEYEMPVIFLTASGDEGSTVVGFDIGADDYIAKPFRPRELISRIKNALRKYSKETSLIRAGNLAIDTEKGTVTKAGNEVVLTALEYRILLYFAVNRGRLISRGRLLEEIWDIAGDFVNDNTLTVYIKRIREKIEDDPADPSVIKTVRGLGYRMD